MKLKASILFVAFAAFGSTVMAAEPGYTCDSNRGCKEVQGPVYDIGRGAKLTLPSGWKFYTTPPHRTRSWKACAKSVRPGMAW